MDWARVRNQGVLKSFTIVHRAAPGIAVPFVSALVETADGTTVRSNLVNCDPDPEAVRLGMKVRLVTYPIGADDDGTDRGRLRLRADPKAEGRNATRTTRTLEPWL